ncbi:cupin domain-containing protein [Peribacillus sp. NPDC096540]|uniref:cupin domain-containing protein n=1 Tax=Peribacillus sp. NPDC096540 TaxID=3390612 RepID=UPI003D058F53
MTLNMDYTSPSTQYTFDVNNSPLFKKDNNNLINILGVNQLNTLENVSLLDIFLSANNVAEPQYHPNAAELNYCISGAITVSMLNPFTKQILNYAITPGQVVNIPQGWWHYQMATADNTHFLAIFDAPTPEVVFGSDILKYTPTNIMAHTYCLDENKWKDAIGPVKPSTVIGPYTNCNSKNENFSQRYLIQQYQQQQYNQQYPYMPQYQQYWGFR